MEPANQRFVAVDFARDGIGDRLVVDFEFVMGQGLQQIVFKRFILLQTLQHPRPDDLYMAAALFFRLRQREVGALVQIIGPAFAIRDHDPDAGVDINLRIVDLIGLADLLPDNIGPLEGHLFGEIVREHRELIAAEAIQRLRGFTEKREAAGQILQQLIAGVMAEGIVYILKAVEVKKHHHGASVIGTHLIDDLLQTLPERETVWHTGQRIMVGVVLQTTVLHLQLLFRDLQIVGQGFHTNVGAPQIIILPQHQQPEGNTHGDQQNGDHRVDIIEMLNFIMGDINDINILRQRGGRH
ncbi:hypothetical protein SB00610_04518 [Klebsiella quasipneumoniae subsp. similipneumoniae]|nr:hypothetical protein SB00610_04518 [Klebsiella quasipneumoniae subsp. similipneumoniae]